MGKSRTETRPSAIEAWLGFLFNLDPEKLQEKEKLLPKIHYSYEGEGGRIELEISGVYAQKDGFTVFGKGYNSILFDTFAKAYRTGKYRKVDENLRKYHEAGLEARKRHGD